MAEPRITLLTGFLGSGKTTFLRNLLQHSAGERRFGLIVNEIGEIGFDGHVLDQAGSAPLVELTGGCICCAAGSDFLFAIEDLIMAAEPEHIIIETTGLAEPGGMIRQIHATKLGLDAVIAVADVVGLDAALAASPVAEWQLQSADLLVLSKTDLANPVALKQAQARLRELNPRAAQIDAQQASREFDLLLGPSTQAIERPDHHDHLHLDGFESFSWQGNQPLRRAAIIELLNQIPDEIYRIKGRIYCSDAPWPDELHYVGGRYDLRPARRSSLPAMLNQLVFIGPYANRASAELSVALNASADSPERSAQWRQSQE